MSWRRREQVLAKTEALTEDEGDLYVRSRTKTWRIILQFSQRLVSETSPRALTEAGFMAEYHACRVKYGKHLPRQVSLCGMHLRLYDPGLKHSRVRGHASSPDHVVLRIVLVCGCTNGSAT